MGKRIPESEWVWSGYPAHFCCASECCFRMATLVGDYIISSVGCMHDSEDSAELQDIGSDRKFETMVFLADLSKTVIDGFPSITGHKVDFEGYNDAKAAHVGHMTMCDKYACNQT